MDGIEELLAKARGGGGGRGGRRGGGRSVLARKEKRKEKRGLVKGRRAAQQRARQQEREAEERERRAQAEREAEAARAAKKRARRKDKKERKRKRGDAAAAADSDGGGAGKRRRGGGAPSTRWEEMVAADSGDNLDREIAYLEGKLGLRGGGGGGDDDDERVRRKKEELNSAWADEGLGDLMDIVSSLEGIGGAAAADAADPGDESMTETEEEPSSDEDDEFGGGGGDSSSSEGEYETNYDENELDAAALAAGSDEDGEADLAPKRKGAYLPPHLRRKAEAEAAEAAAAAAASATAKEAAAASRKAEEDDQGTPELRRRVKGLLNRLTDDNLEPISAEFRAVYANNGRNTVTAVLGRLVIKAVSDEQQVLQSLVQSVSSLVVLLHCQIGSEVGAMFLERLAHSFRAAHDAGRKKEAANLLMLLAHLYAFEVVHCSLMYDLVRVFLDSFRPLDLELLLAVLRQSGFQMRKDDPKALKEIILRTQARAREVGVSGGGKGGNDSDDDGDGGDDGDSAASGGMSSARVRYMLDMVSNLKNNKRHGTDPAELLRPLKQKIRRLVPVQPHDRQMRIGWSDLLQSKTKGRWWLVGSAWEQGKTGKAEAGGAGDGNDGGQGAGAGAGGLRDEDLDAGADDAEDIAALAQRQRMTTDFRKAVFCVVMGAEDYMDAFEKLLKLQAKGTQDREVARIVLDCCGQERAYNPFYTLVAFKLCEFQKKYRFTYQLAYWDLFKEMAEGGAAAVPARRAMNLARMLAYLVSRNMVSLASLKVVDFGSMGQLSSLFFTALFSALLFRDSAPPAQPAPTNSRIVDVFGRLAGKPELDDLRDGIAFFFHRHMRPVVEALRASGAAVPCERGDDQELAWKQARRALRLAQKVMQHTFDEADEER